MRPLIGGAQLSIRLSTTVSLRCPGDGDLDFEPLIQKIAADGYNGWLLVEAEQDPLKADPPKMASTSMAYISDLLARHHLTFERNTYCDAI